MEEPLKEADSTHSGSYLHLRDHDDPSLLVCIADPSKAFLGTLGYILSPGNRRFVTPELCFRPS